MTIQNYILNLNTRFKSGISTEHSYRGDLQNLLESIVTNVLVTNEPSRVACGAPDYIITKKDIPLGYIEAKDIGADLNNKQYKEQFDRYKSSLNNLIITDYLSFRLFRDGILVASISVGSIDANKIVPLTGNFDAFTNLIKDFCLYKGQTITSSSRLSKMMAGKARLLADIIEKALSQNDDVDNNTLHDQLNSFKQILIHDITPKEFADIYSQTIAYGMFAARLHDTTLDNFSRQEAAELIPKSNPFLRKLFQYIAGYDLDDRIRWIVDALADLFAATNIAELLKDFGKSTQQFDPMIHFYETFLSEYDPALRKSRGVWYTPEPVVNFIVRAVDDILKDEFGLSQGLADNSKTTIKVNLQATDKRYKDNIKTIEQEVHKVQILDPACGTGTFLAQVIKHIHKKFENQQGIWSNYVDEHLIPRLNGFEILMASYAMAHLKLDLLLKETGYKPLKEQRFRVYLTNSLEEHHPETGTLFANWLSAEANEANYIKRDTPVMVVLGNPPYSGESSNKGEWILKLMEDYKKEPGGIIKLKEKNSKFINDDYVKFLRYGQYFIEKNGEGILAFINPHGYLDNPTFRGMRWNLLKTYDKIYTIDLHGNAKKKEVSPDGSPDINVFDIEQGVSINLFIKTGIKKQNEFAKIFHYDLYGKRELKYDFLLNNNIKTTPYKNIENTHPSYFFRPKDFEEQSNYDKCFYISELFIECSLGVLSKNDDITISFNKSILKERIINFTTLNESEIKSKYRIKKDSRDWMLIKAINDLKENNKEVNYKQISYRPFDNRWTYFTGKPRGFFAYSQNRIMQNFNIPNNFALISGRQGQAVGSMIWNLSFISNTISDQNIFYRGGGTIFPLYSIKETNGQQSTEQTSIRTPNLNLEIVKQIAEKLGLTFVPEKNSSPPFKGGVSERRGGLNENSVSENQVVLNENSLSENQTGLNENSVSERQGGYDRIMNLPHLKTFRKELRKNLTPAEATLWTMLQGSQLEGRKFRRQHSVDNYILDFYCPEEKLAIELDGEVHFNEKAQEYDKERDLFLQYFGIKVLRFENKYVFDRTATVLDEIKKEFGWSKATTPLNSPPLKVGELDEFAPIDILDYIYAVLHSPSYREKYKEFLKIDFPRVPYPKDKETFWHLVKLGTELRQIHLLESPVFSSLITTYPQSGSNLVDKIKYEPICHSESSEESKSNSIVIGRVFINSNQYFDNVPEIAWNFFIGGYQPAQKWLKDRKARTLSFDDITHYQKIIIALTSTDRIMNLIDQINIE